MLLLLRWELALELGICDEKTGGHGLHVLLYFAAY